MQVKGFTDGGRAARVGRRDRRGRGRRLRGGRPPQASRGARARHGVANAADLPGAHLPQYGEVTRRHEAGTGPSYAAVTCFNLDEYVGRPAGHEQSYRATIAREPTDGPGISPEPGN